MTEPTKLHFTRIRAHGEGSFYDPNTDIRKLLPAIIKQTLSVLWDKYEGTPLMEEFRKLQNFFIIFQIRLAEDPTPCSEQVSAFFSAVQQVSAEARSIWLKHMAILLLCVYGLYTRRDVRADGATVNAMIDTGRYAALMQDLSEDTKARIKADIGKVSAEQLASPCNETSEARGFAVCDETMEVLENIQSLVLAYISHTGPGDWDSLAAECDKAFGVGDKPLRAELALALAYPNYKQPNLTVETNEPVESQTHETEEI